MLLKIKLCFFPICLFNTFKEKTKIEENWSIKHKLTQIKKKQGKHTHTQAHLM